MSAGQYRYFVTIQHPVRTPDPDGGWAEDWTEAGNAWISIEAPEGVTEGLVANTERSVSILRVETRYDARITLESRLEKEDGSHLYIRGLTPLDFRNRTLVLTCEARP